MTRNTAVVRKKSEWCGVVKLNGHHSIPNHFETGPRDLNNRYSRKSETSTAADFLHRGLNVRVRLTRKLSEAINGLDLRPFSVGQVLDLTDPLGRMLIAERWGEEVVPLDQQATADDREKAPAKRAGKGRRTAPSRPLAPRRERRAASRSKKT